MKKNNSALITVDREYYPKEAIITTCCRFLGDNYIFLENEGNATIRVTLTPKRTTAEFKKIKGEFKNELIDNTLRYNISQRNKEIRECIIKTALFFSQPHEAAGDSPFKELEEAQMQDWKEDPLGIAIPWQEKHKRRSKKIKS